MEKVKKLIEAGATIQGAIREAIGIPITQFAEKYNLPRSSVHNHITGHVKASDATVNALVAELGGTPDEWRMLLWEAARPVKVAV